MPVPTNISDLSTTAGSNPPSGSETPQEGDNHLRAAYSFIRQISDRMDGTTSFNASFIGNVTLGDAAADTVTINGTTTFPLAVTTHTFGAKVGNVSRADTATLDWYEEGSFTPALSFAGGTTGLTYASRSGAFTRIGNIVFYSLSMQVATKGSSTGFAAIGGLPYAASSQTCMSGSVGAFNFAVGYTEDWKGRVLAGATNLALFKVVANTSDLSVNDTDFKDLGSLDVSGFYFV